MSSPHLMFIFKIHQVVSSLVYLLTILVGHWCGNLQKKNRFCKILTVTVRFRSSEEITQWRCYIDKSLEISSFFFFWHVALLWYTFAELYRECLSIRTIPDLESRVKGYRNGSNPKVRIYIFEYSELGKASLLFNCSWNPQVLSIEGNELLNRFHLIFGEFTWTTYFVEIFPTLSKSQATSL